MRASLTTRQAPKAALREAAAFGAVEVRFVAGAMARLDRRDLEGRVLPVERHRGRGQNRQPEKPHHLNILSIPEFG